MAIVTGDRYLESLVKFVENHAEALIEGTLILKLNPVGLHYVHSRLEAFAELESLIAGAPVDYLRAYVSDLGDHRALEQLRRILRLLTSIKVVSVLPPPFRDPTPLSLLPFARLRVLELRGCDLSTSAARGLLELRHTLEKLICHNSTNALRHIFTSRIADVKNSPTWNRLSYVSCACNGLVLMDESLQLLPVVETLDLSRNKLSKVDNLRKCNKLKHLDLGFNHLRTIASFSEVTFQIVKLGLRNNALTSLHGLENLKSLEGLDLSYNMISNFSDIEILSGLPSLRRLWLEGNPICCARWYRAQVFSLFPYPDTLELDEKRICTSELWKRQIIVASRQKDPASFGFYSPANDDSPIVGTINTKRKKLSRVVSIETEERSTYVLSDEDSGSCDKEVQNEEDRAVSDDEAEIVQLMDRIEQMKKERSDLWLQEFREWMFESRHELLDNARGAGKTSSNAKENNVKVRKSRKDMGESSRYMSDSIQAFGDDSSTNVVESDNSFADTSTSLSCQQYSNGLSEAASTFFPQHLNEASAPMIGSKTYLQNVKSKNKELFLGLGARSVHFDSLALPGTDVLGRIDISRPPNAVEDITHSNSLSASPASPPQYKKDILHRRQNLEEEFLQLSAESLSVASSDSETSCSEESSSDFGPLISEVDQSIIDSMCKRSTAGCSSATHVEYLCDDDMSTLNGNVDLHSNAEPNSTSGKVRELSNCIHWSRGRIVSDGHDAEAACFVDQETKYNENKSRKLKHKQRIASLFEQNGGECRDCQCEVLSGKVVEQGGLQISYGSDLTLNLCHSNACGKFHWRDSLSSGNFIADTFNRNIGDSSIHEICEQYICCAFLPQDRSGCSGREIAVLLSSAQKLYILLIVGTCDGSGESLQVVGCHGVADVKEVIVGLALQVVRVCFQGDVAYLLITRSIEKSRELLGMLCFVSSSMAENNFCLTSVEQVQVNLIERHVCGGSTVSIFQYAVVLFWSSSFQEDQWLSRSLFVLQEHIVICLEDLTQLGSLVMGASSTSYLLLDSCCSIHKLSQMVIDESNCSVTLILENAQHEFHASRKSDLGQNAALVKGCPASGPLTWKLKWYSDESLLQFVSLVQAIHG